LQASIPPKSRKKKMDKKAARNSSRLKKAQLKLLSATPYLLKVFL